MPSVVAMVAVPAVADVGVKQVMAGGAVAVLRSGHATLVGGGRRTIRAADIDCGAAGQQGVGLGGAAVYIRPGLVDRPLFFALQSMMLGENSLLARLGQGRSGRGDASPF